MRLDQAYLHFNYLSKQHIGIKYELVNIHSQYEYYINQA